MPISNYYTGIGSRKTPQHILDKMAEYATKLHSQGWNLYSGAAEGADRAFEAAVAALGGTERRCVTFIPWQGHSTPLGACISSFVPDESKFEEAADLLQYTYKIKRNFDEMREGAQKLHARNVWQILGLTPQLQSQFVLYWTDGDPKRGPTGGTRTAVLLAQKLGIPTYHLGCPDQTAEFERLWLKN